jgi:hypothetical protein
MENPTLIYCADGNRKFAEIALRHGYFYGAQLPNTVYFEPHFADQNWKKPVRSKYMDTLKKYRPALATVLDWEVEKQLSEVLSWAEEAAQYVTDSVIIIPKVIGGIKRLPRQIGGKSVRLGYSAASTFSGTPVSLSEFKGWPVHCLGAGPARQMEIARQVDVKSADGNYIQNVARNFCQFYSPGTITKHNSWSTLRYLGLGHIRQDAIYLAFELTCIAVPMAWNGQSGSQIHDAQISFLESQGFKPARQMSLWRDLCSDCTH